MPEMSKLSDNFFFRNGQILKEDGESSATLLAIIEFAKDFRPPIIILENIRSRPRSIASDDREWEEIRMHPSTDCIPERRRLQFVGAGGRLRSSLLRSDLLPQGAPRSFLTTCANTAGGGRTAS